MRVLIIDDEEDTRSIFSMSLGLLGGIDVIEAGSGPEGIEQAANENPDVIILDLLMPDMDGTQTFLALKEHAQTRQIPVIFMTVKGMFSEFEALKGMGALAVIAKPFDPTTLTQIIKNILDNNGYGHVTGNGSAPESMGASSTGEKAAKISLETAADIPAGIVVDVPVEAPPEERTENLQEKPQEKLAASATSVVDTGPQNGNMKDVHLPATTLAQTGSRPSVKGSRAGNNSAVKKPSDVASKKPISAAQRILARKKARGENSKKSGGKSGSK